MWENQAKDTITCMYLFWHGELAVLAKYMYINSTTHNLNRVLVSAQVFNCMKTNGNTSRKKRDFSSPNCCYWQSKGLIISYPVPSQFLLFAMLRDNGLSHVFRVCFLRNRQRFEGVFVSVASGLKMSHLSVFMDLEIRLRWIQQVLNILKNWQERFYFIKLI